MSQLLKLSIAIFALFYSALSIAVPVYYGDRTSFEGASTGLTTEDFEGMSSGTYSDITTADYTIDSAPGGRPDDIFIAPAGYTSGITSNVAFANYFVDSLIISFGSGVTAFGADIQSQYSTSIFDILIYDTSNVLIDSVVMSVADSATFFGLTTNVAIGSIVFDSRTDQAEGVDNMSYGVAVPEPATLLLMGLGLVGFGFAGKRKA